MVVVCEHKLTCGQRGGLKDAMQLDTLDFNKKILHASWHPRENTIAVSCHHHLRTHQVLTSTQIAATNNLFLYSAA